MIPKVHLVNGGPDLRILVEAARTCTNTEGRSDTYRRTLGPKDLELIKRLVEKKHFSVLEHAVYTFKIENITRACLQEVVRHRIASYSVQSTRYTLQKLRTSDKVSSYYMALTKNSDVNLANISQLDKCRELLCEGYPNDVVKYMLPEAFLTRMVMTINARSLRNFLDLRTGKRALKEIQLLAHQMFEALPHSHRFLFMDCVHPTNE